MKIIPKCIKSKRHLCASGSILLPLAQKWGLVGAVAICALSVLGARSASAASLSISVPGNLSVDVQPGGPAKESASAGFTVTSDAYWGYTLSIKSSNAEGALINGINKISSIGDSVTNLNQFTNNTWGFRVGGEGVTNTNYRQGPTTSTTNLATTTGKKGGQETGTYSFTLAAKIDNTIPTGAYTGTFTFMATANAVNYTINYDDNDGTDGPGKVTSQSQEQFVKIDAKEPTKQDRVFLGWCDQEVSNNGTCDGTIYQPGNDYEITAANQETTLYAMWDWITMQNWDDCSKNLVKNKQFTLVDSRDNRAYYIAKLADGNCWMTENLDLYIDEKRIYTVDDTDLAYASEEDKKNSPDENGHYQWEPDKNTYTTNIWSTTHSGDTTQQSYDPGNYCWKGEKTWLEISEHFSEDSRTCAQHDISHFHIGNYYNYSAAVAQNDTASHTSQGQAYETSICPAGWQLPEWEGDKSFQNLYEKVNWVTGDIEESTIDKPPYYYPYAGFWRRSWLNFGSSAAFYTKAVRTSTAAYIMDFFAGENGVRPQFPNAMRLDGFSVRCVAR